MADHAEDVVDNDLEDIFVYRGGRAPQHITHARIDKSVYDIEDHAFYFCKRLLQVDTHDGIRRVGTRAFRSCRSLRRINLKSVVEIDELAFYFCGNLEPAEFGDMLETIGNSVFTGCTSLKHLKLPSIITIGDSAFASCTRLTDIDLSERLERIGAGAFYNCKSLQRIAVPLKRDLFKFSDISHKYSQFDKCEQLTTVDLVGGDHKTVASLHMESWRTEMISEINRMNQILPTTPEDEKTEEIRQWINSVMDKLDHYKSKHYRYVTEGITLLELALWKANLGESEEYAAEGKTKKVNVDVDNSRKDKRMTCGADIVINNALPFLQLE